MMTERGRARTGVAVYGANGYTGRLITRELLAMGHEVTVAGRSVEPLRSLAAECGGGVRRAVVTLDDHAGLLALAASVRTVVNAAGPFSRTCAPVARAAVAAGAHYVDISGEQHAIRALFDNHGPDAIANGVALLPASAYYATLCDLLVGLTAGESGPIDDLDIAYHVRGWVPSGAAFVNRLEGIGQPMIQYDNGFVDVVRPPATRTVSFGPQARPRRVTMYPAPEVLTIPRHVDAARIRTSMTTSTLIRKPLGRLVPYISAVAAAVRDTPAAGPTERLLALGATGSSIRVHDDPSSFDLVAVLHGRDGTRTATLSGPGIFDITGPIAARIAARTLAADFGRSGPLAASEVLDPREFLDGLRDRGVTYRISPADGVGDGSGGRSVAAPANP
ncbi:saccharopine dehydrogenase NADP-binding domain-containing protein [Nocardia sp. NPDC005978]|uniref:saccharopine dehydrogenase NADP-binding domain-containing protein n=1 Tax=Nocardia sp. NPDC005978 TaxID=3156725 RepID=UPI0033B8AAFC